MTNQLPMRAAHDSDLLLITYLTVSSEKRG